LAMSDSITEADQLPAPASDVSNDFHWVEAMSKNGKPFRIGYSKADSESLTERSELASDAAPSAVETNGLKYYKVNWPVGDSSWKPVTEVPQLTRYALYENTPPRFFQYTLDVYLTNTGWGTAYTFQDQKGDSYALTAYTDGKHSVAYDSEAPTIVLVGTEQEF
ncbi:hypothetical protein C8J56DRAFT_793566, partial [Mycena floridula]